MVPVEVVLQSGPRRFKFENAWLSEPMYKQLVKDGWEGNIHSIILYKVRHCGEVLNTWGKEITSDFGSRIKKCKVELKRLRNKTDSFYL